MKICIVRHGSAEIGADNDSQRALTTKGTDQARGAGKWVAGLLADGVLANDTKILSSPYLRAEQTAQQIQLASKLELEQLNTITPAGDVDAIVDELTQSENDLILVSHLPLVGRLAAKLVDGQVYDQPWSPAECWLLEGDIAAAGCMTVTSVWYPALEEG